MPQPLQLSAATGGLTAALVSSLFSQEPVLPPLHCQDIIGAEQFSWATLLLGILLGLVLAQLFDLLYLVRAYLTLQLRQRSWWLPNSAALRQRLA